MRPLKSISNQELINSLKNLVKEERDLTLNILPRMLELDRRLLYRDLGYSSLYDYCTRELKYSESAAVRRIHAARALARCPEVLEYLSKRLVTLSTISLIRKIVIPALLDRISNKSKRQVEAIVAANHPQEKIKDRVKPVVVEQLVKLPAASRSPGPFDSPPEIGSQCKDIYRRGGGKKSVTDEMSTPALEDTIVRRRVRMHEIRCMIDDGVMQDLERCKVLLSGKFPRGLDYSKLFNELASQWLERHDPVRRGERREKKNPTVRGRGKSRHIPAAVRDEVFERDGGRCTFVGSTGKRCASTWDLEVHHDGTPYGRGGSHSIKNLKLLCAAHNKLEAERTYGQAHMQKFYIKESGVSCRTAYRIHGLHAGSEISASRSSLDHHFCDGRSSRDRHIHTGQYSYDAINIITP